MDVIYKGEKLKFVQDFHGEQVLWITDPCQINMEHMRFVGGYPNEYCILLSDLSADEKEQVLKQVKRRSE